MSFSRHTVALAALFSSGCFLFHGGEPGPDPRPRPIPRDAGPGGPDGGPAPMCFDTEGVVQALACPGAVFEVGSYVELQVTHSVTGCCASGVGTLGVANDGLGEWYVESYWADVCDCCDECECVGPSEEATVRIGPLREGSNFVHAGGMGCDLYAEELSMCAPTAAEARSARVLFPDQTDDLTLSHVEPADCGCEPRLRAGGGDAQLELCGCADGCDDVITRYEAHHVGETRPLGEYSRVLGGAAVPLSVRDPSQCLPLEPLRLQVEVADPSAYQSGEPIVWVGIGGEQALCCAEPAPAARSELAPDGVIDVTLFSCVTEDCLCVPPGPTPFTAWHSLGPLAPGRYTVAAGAHTARFRVR